MFDYTTLAKDQLQLLATYILSHEYPSTDMFDEMCADLSALKVVVLRGTIGCLKGRFFNDRFLKSPYWQIIAKHFRREGICPICKVQKTLVIYGPSYHNLGVNHLHPEDHLLACGDCHKTLYQFGKDTRFWSPQRYETEHKVREFLEILKRQR
jgi:hypothetical protein